MSNLAIIGALSVLAAGILIMIALGSIFMLVHNWYKHGTNERLTKLEEGQAKLEKGQENLNKRMDHLGQEVAKLTTEIIVIKSSLDYLVKVIRDMKNPRQEPLLGLSENNKKKS